MTPKMLVMSICATVSLVACSEPSVAPTGPRAFAGKVKEQPVLLGMTVLDQGPAGAYRIASDGKGEYVNGVDNLSASIDVYGNLWIGPSAPSATQTRTLKFDFSAPLDPNNTYRPDESGQQQWRILSNANIGTGTSPRIQDLGVNGNPASACYGASTVHQNAGTSYDDQWNPALQSPSVDVYITRTSATTWTVVSNGPCAGTADVADMRSIPVSAKGHIVWTDRGSYYQSFSLVLRSL